MPNPVEIWKNEKHGLDVWSDVLRYAGAKTPMAEISDPDLERMKWHGFFYRKRDGNGRYMNRVRITGSELTADQAKEIAYIAYEYGHGIVDVTTRANIQIQGIEIEHVPQVVARLERVGLTSKQTGHDNIRNVFAHPYSGLLPDELIDTRPLCHAITALFLDSREYSDLPRKFNICLNGTEQHSAHFWSQDLSFLACRDEGNDVWFRVLIGGTQGQNPQLAQHLPVLVRPDQVVGVTTGLLDLFRRRGSREKRNAARFRFLLDEIGVGGVLEWLDETLPFRLQPCVSEPVLASQYDDLIGWFRQKSSQLWVMGLSVPLGRMSWSQLEGLAVISKKWGDGSLRTTHEQGMAVVNIPTGFKDSAATSAAAHGLSVHADPLTRNTMACTGNQFCNIAVTATKGHMFQLIERLRQKGLTLHGIRIHMSGCPSSCAQHFTADIGLKGVRVRRLMGTREGFDIFLGGGIAGKVHLALPYKLGVDVDQLPEAIEQVVTDYYLRHRPGQTFSAYWRERLRQKEAEKVGEADYHPPIWICDACEYQHTGEDPPVFCPSCAGLRRNFARVDDEDESAVAASTKPVTAEPASNRTDGFVFAAEAAALSEKQGLRVEVGGKAYALFRVEGAIRCIDADCPHEGASLAEGEISNGVVTCPWHSWTFDLCKGCSLDPPGQSVNTYETRVENERIYIRPKDGAAHTESGSGNGSSQDRPAVTVQGRPSPGRPGEGARPSAPIVASLTVLEVIEEAPDIRTFRLDNSVAKLPLDLPGRFAKVCVPTSEGEAWRSFTISSSPANAAVVELTIKLNRGGRVSSYLFENARPGTAIQLKGPLGGFFFDPERHREPLILLSAGSGITPMMSIARFLRDTDNPLRCEFVYGARTAADILLQDECLQMAATRPSFRYFVTLSQPGASWTGATGRLDFARLCEMAGTPSPAGRYFLCGPNEFMDSLQVSLLEAGIPRERIHTEQFHATKTPIAGSC
jgi:ferredoxin-nitrite reductase